ncbi:alcohol dehydrogenase catalytic domain-containing protein [Caballeronia sp. KNU42]
MTNVRAARFHKVEEEGKVDKIPVPEPRPTDGLIRAKAYGVVPNLRNVVAHYPQRFPSPPLPKLPAIFGPDASRVVERVGSHVHCVKVGDRVCISPGLCL